MRLFLAVLLLLLMPSVAMATEHVGDNPATPKVIPWWLEGKVARTHVPTRAATRHLHNFRKTVGLASTQAVTLAGVTRYVSTTGSGTTCTQAAPCKTIRAAYLAASDGDTIQLAAGTYPAQGTSTQSAIDGAKVVTVLGGPGVVVRQFANSGSNYVVDGLDIDGGGGKASDPNMALYETGGGANIVVRNTRIGNVQDQKGAVLGGQVSSAPLNVTLDNVTFHDVNPVGSQVHNECVFSQVPGLVATRSYFDVPCGNTGPLVITRGDWWGQQTYNTGTYTDNTFARQLFDHGSIIFGNACTSCGGFTIKGNTFDSHSMPAITSSQTFGGSTESCNSPRVDLPGILHPSCVGPDPTPTPTPSPTPEPSPTATPEPTPTPTPEPTPEPTPAPYAPQCQPDCDATIQSLQDQITSLRARIQQALDALTD